MVRKKDCRDTTMVTAETTIQEARHFANKLVENERGKCGGDVDMAIYRASCLTGIEEGTFRSLRYRWRALRFVKAHIYERLRQADAWLEEQSARQQAILQDTAETLERAGHPAAGLARRAADLAGEED